MLGLWLDPSASGSCRELEAVQAEHRDVLMSRKDVALFIHLDQFTYKISFKSPCITAHSCIPQITSPRRQLHGNCACEA